MICSKNRAWKKQSGLGAGSGWTLSQVTAKASPHGGNLGGAQVFLALWFQALGVNLPNHIFPVHWMGADIFPTREKEGSIEEIDVLLPIRWLTLLCVWKRSQTWLPFCSRRRICVQSVLFCLLAQDSNRGFVVVVVVVSSFKQAFLWVDVKAFGFIWRMVSYFIPSCLCKFFCFILMW